MFFAESAILVHFKSVGGSFAVFIGVVVALFALGASKNHFHSVSFLRCHNDLLFATKNLSEKIFRTQKITPLKEVLSYINTTLARCQRLKPDFFRLFAKNRVAYRQ